MFWFSLRLLGDTGGTNNGGRHRENRPKGKRSHESWSGRRQPSFLFVPHHTAIQECSKLDTMKVAAQWIGCRLIPILLFALCATGCEKRERRRQIELEGLTAATIQKFLTLHEGTSAGEPITNVAQIFAMMDLTSAHRVHPYVLQQRFREFGRNAGFKSSIYDKYVILPHGLTNRAIKGEMILMSAEPFPDLDGHPVRMVIWKAAKQDYRQTELLERRVQEIFSEANIPIPRADVSSPAVPPAGDYKLTYPFTTRVRMYFQSFAELLGLGKMFWFPLMLLCAVVLIAGMMFSIWILRRNR